MGPRRQQRGDSLAVSPDDSHAIVGGYFTDQRRDAERDRRDLRDHRARTSRSPRTSSRGSGSCTSSVKDVIISGSTAYLAAEGNGGGCFDGDFAVNVSTDSLVWQNDCLGATQSLVLIHGLLFKGSHAHDCAYAPGGFPQVDQRRRLGHLAPARPVAHRRHARPLDAGHQVGTPAGGGTSARRRWPPTAASCSSAVTSPR